ncbi:ROK family protein [Belnapia sp. T18]|uniref:ROK family protein n=1 Tax=Belnapia arida TaxID=2804533 RepID=A0ABS1U933_9PROT|nr:ROK family protein [Belnapia arida]MBL6081198.1 ROK family protein [Belnapia arida]
MSATGTKEDDAKPSIQTVVHGSANLPRVRVDTYNAELRDASGQSFLGDRASNRAFVEILEDWRERVRRGSDGGDPLGAHRPSDDISREELDRVVQMAEEDPEAAGLVQSAIEDFAQEMAGVVRRILRLPEWQGTKRIALGGGFLGSRVGHMAIGRVGVLLKASGEPVQLSPVSRRPDDAALCGAVQLAPPETLRQWDAILAVDIGGTNMRVGLVALEQEAAADLSRARVLATERWCHAQDKPGREQAIERLVAMLSRLVSKAKEEGLRLAPFIGVGCPGVIRADGTIERGGQNLPGGDWENSAFHLPSCLTAALPKIDNQKPAIVMHNDAVVQGLSEAPNMRTVERWGVLTIGTGLGNARFTNKPA